jgi:hypothetical protein
VDNEWFKPFWPIITSEANRATQVYGTRWFEFGDFWSIGFLALCNEWDESANRWYVKAILWGAFSKAIKGAQRHFGGVPYDEESWIPTSYLTWRRTARRVDRMLAWSRKHDCCTCCKTTERKHAGKGLCTACYMREREGKTVFSRGRRKEAAKCQN